MTLPLDVLHRSPEEVARRITLALLDEARAACDRLADPADATALHEFRVAVRRMRSTLRAWRGELRGALGKKDAKALRALQQATGGGRDAEVALAWLDAQRATIRGAHRRGYQWLAERLGERLGASMDHVRAKLRTKFDRLEDHLRARLGHMIVEVHLDSRAPARRFGDVFAEKARAHVRQLAKRLGRIASIEDEAQAHEARIRCKRLRYLVEPITTHVQEARAVVKACKRLQDVLGDLNDTHVLRDETSRALEQSAAEHARHLDELMRQDDTDALQRAMRLTPRAGLIEIARRLHQRRADLYARLVERWIDDGAATLVEAVEALARRVEQGLAPGVEIERKYLLRGAPVLPEGAEVVEIEQGYLPGKSMEERVRRQRDGTAERFVRTIKLGRGLRRLEVEEEIGRAVFDALWPLTEGRRVCKRRHVVRAGDQVWEIDEFLDRDLWLAEIELEHEDADVALPAWLAPLLVREVTTSGEYANRRLAM